MDKEKPVLTDRDETPTEELIFSRLGKSKKLWASLFEYLHSNHSNLSEQWNYYNDGKCWLMKVVNKSKTVFWLSVLNGSFRITFYFTDKAAEAIAASPIPGELKDQFKEGKRYNKIRGLTIVFKSGKDVECAKSLLAIKLSMK